MGNIIILVIILLGLMVFFVGLGLYFHRHPECETNDTSEYVDADGNHEYYERSIIEKKEFERRHPETKGKLRTFSRLLKSENEINL